MKLHKGTKEKETIISKIGTLTKKKKHTRSNLEKGKRRGTITNTRTARIQ